MIKGFLESKMWCKDVTEVIKIESTKQRTNFTVSAETLSLDTREPERPSWTPLFV